MEMYCIDAARVVPGNLFQTRGPATEKWQSPSEMGWSMLMKTMQAARLSMKRFLVVMPGCSTVQCQALFWVWIGIGRAEIPRYRFSNLFSGWWHWWRTMYTGRSLL